ncbi:O-antigen ligase family protein [Aurantivibrio plasticivorans]
MCAKAIRPAIAPPNRLTGHIITASCVLAALTFVATTTLTGTRTAILGLVIASCFAQWASGRHLSLTLIVAIGFWVLAVALFDETNVLNKLLNRGGFGSLRPQIWHESLTKSVDSWFAGAGMWSDSTINISKADGSLSKQPHAHSAYLQLFHWTGAIGILSYASIYARSSFLCFGSRHTILGGTSLLLLCYFASVQMFDVYSVISKPNQYWVCVWLPIGIILGITATHTYPANSTEN